jgi:hypothetical protein
VVRTHSAAEGDYLRRVGVQRAVNAERELAFAMAHDALEILGCEGDAADAIVARLREGAGQGDGAGGGEAGRMAPPGGAS